MAKKNTKRKLIGLVSNLSNHRTYYTTVNTQNRTTKGQGKLTLRKYDPIAKQHATYTETKKNLGRNEVKARKSEFNRIIQKLPRVKREFLFGKNV